MLELTSQRWVGVRVVAQVDSRRLLVVMVVLQNSFGDITVGNVDAGAHGILLSPR